MGETIKALRHTFGAGHVQLCGQQAVLKYTDLLLVRLCKYLGHLDAASGGTQPMEGAKRPAAICVTEKATRSQIVHGETREGFIESKGRGSGAQQPPGTSTKDKHHDEYREKCFFHALTPCSKR